MNAPKKYCIHDKGMICGMPQNLCPFCAQTLLPFLGKYGPNKIRNKSQHEEVKQ
jgi:hypothetical protein